MGCGVHRASAAAVQAVLEIGLCDFRPEEEEGRDLPWKKRNDLLHVDAFPTRPTYGDLILRVFSNIHPEKPRVWRTSDPFQQLAPRYAADAGLVRVAEAAGAGMERARRGITRGLKSVGFPVVDRSPYDRFMLGFHDYMKGNTAYQNSCRKYNFELPPGSTWMVFAGIVPHAVLSGRFALEQTFIIARSSLSDPEPAPASILERLSQTTLTV